MRRWVGDIDEECVPGGSVWQKAGGKDAGHCRTTVVALVRS